MKKIFFIILLILSLAIFYHINSSNYEKITEIKYSIVQHPENLPTKEIAKKTALGFANLRADLYWLQAIQYIGGNAVNSEYKKYLYSMLDIITELNPFFEHPYIIGELLLPGYNPRYENLSLKEQQINTRQAIKIGKKGVQNFCDSKKLEAIKKEFNLNKLSIEEQYKNPCKSYKIPYNLAFVYYYYLHDSATASYYYRVASANEDSLEGAKVMASIMQGKAGNREKSFFMFLNMASSVEEKDEVCTAFSQQLNALALGGKIKNDTHTVKVIETERKKLFPQTESEGEKTGPLNEAQCSNYLNKAIRELNLSYIELAHHKYLAEKKEPAKNAKVLFDEGYLEFLPTDPQNTGDEDFGIIYKYNKDTKNFDYGIGKY